MNMNIERIARGARRTYRKNKKLMLTLLGGALAGVTAIMLSKLT